MLLQLLVVFSCSVRFHQNFEVLLIFSSEKVQWFKLLEMSYIGSDAEQDKPDFRRQRSSSNLVAKSTELWNAKREAAAANCDDSGN